jgi:polysaccharide deacetylase family protein (PEP-CTERM system associated)
MASNLKFGPPIITVDIEDWPESSLDSRLSITTRVVRNTTKILDILGRARVKATMFVLGKVVEAFPDLVREIKAEGHEIASHDHGHVAVFRRSQQEFRETLKRCKEELEDLIGVRVLGYRAPDFSINDKSLWALEVLVDLGFEYDSSIFPIKRPRYGISGWPAHPVWVSLGSGGKLIECPVGTGQLFDTKLPTGGGGYHRLFPGNLFRYLAMRTLAVRPFIFYCHPYEFDPLEFRETALPVSYFRRVHQGLGRSSVEARFKRFLDQFGGRRLCDFLSTPDSVQHEVRLDCCPSSMVGGPEVLTSDL